MKFLAEAIVSFFDLVEAEGRALRKNVLGICFAVVLFLIAGVFVVAGFLLAVAGLHVAIANVYGAMTAYFATAAVTAVTAGLFFLLGFRVIARGAKREEVADNERDERNDAQGKEPGGDGGRSGQEPAAPLDGEREP